MLSKKMRYQHTEQTERHMSNSLEIWIDNGPMGIKGLSDVGLKSIQGLETSNSSDGLVILRSEPTFMLFRT